MCVCVCVSVKLNRLKVKGHDWILLEPINTQTGQRHFLHKGNEESDGLRASLEGLGNTPATGCTGTQQPMETSPASHNYMIK